MEANQTYPGSPAIHNAAEFDPGDPYAAGNATNFKAVVDAHAINQSQIAQETTRQQSRNYHNLLDQNQQLFANTLQQNQSLFQVALTTLSNMAIISAKTVDKDTNEISSEAIGAQIVAELSPAIANAVDASVVATLGDQAVAHGALSAAIADAVVSQLAAKG